MSIEKDCSTCGKLTDKGRCHAENCFRSNGFPKWTPDPRLRPGGVVKVDGSFNDPKVYGKILDDTFPIATETACPPQPLNVYEARHLGREYCQTEGSDHYKGGQVESIDLMISKGIAEDFFLGSILKYATRFKRTRNPDDLKKIADYAHLLCGIELSKQKEG